MIQLDHVGKQYPSSSSWAVRYLNLDVEKGELLVLLGGSGSGKTTTLKMVNRLIEPTEGQILIDGHDTVSGDPVQLRRSIGYAFQGIGLFPHFTIAQNVGAVPSLLGWSQTEIQTRVQELLELVNLDPDVFAERKPSELSGGQQQRVGVARALAARPQVMLLDEPFGALDPLTRDALQQEYLTIHRSQGLTAILVTHDMTEALLLADRIAVMDQGTILQVGTPSELLRNPDHPNVEQLMQTPRRQADQLEALLRGGGNE
ncbi:ATP-binding cassette domain-containing protein [bacterium]|nr:ATP-binding cassette domain-containing protein [bacterium]